MVNKYKQNKSSNSAGPEYVLVYSTDSKEEKLCQKCANSIFSCTCKLVVKKISATVKPLIQIEKHGRGGKVVTLLKRLPAEENFLKDLCVYLKRTFGSGGTYYIDGIEGVVEIQGDRRKGLMELLKEYLLQRKD